MKICTSHSIQIQTAANDRNLTTELTANARNSITLNSTKVFGEEMFKRDVCPLCELKANDGDPDDWVNGSCDDQVEVGKQWNLL